MEKLRVMFLCTGNACRSQMAEGWAKNIASDVMEVKSAGIEVHGQNSHTIQVMAEEGIDISKQDSIRVNGDLLEWADVLVTLCDNAEEQCPVIGPDTLTLHLPLPDPAKFKGSEDEVLMEFREARDKIKQRINYLIGHLDED